MKETVFALILAILMEFPDESFLIGQHNIYGIKTQNGHRPRQIIIKPFSWIRRHRINGKSLSFAKTHSFEQQRTLSLCEDPKNIHIVKVKRIGGGYPYGPKNGSLSNNQVCKKQFKGTAIEMLMGELLKEIDRNVGAKQLKSAIWCSYCRAYWKRQSNLQKVLKCCST